MALSEQQWGDIRTQWIATNRAIREIGREFNVSPAAIRKQAEKNGWGPRNAPDQVRGMVASHLAGSRLSSHREPQTEIEEAISSAAEEAVEDMQLALSLGRTLLLRCKGLLDMRDPDDPEKVLTLSPKDLAGIAGTWKMTVEGIRKIRGLDAPPSPAGSGAQVVIGIPALED